MLVIYLFLNILTPKKAGMENRQASPVRSRFIRFNLPKRIFPEDFFRGRSQSPKSNSSTLPLTGLK